MLKDDVRVAIEKEIRELLPESDSELGPLTGEEQVHELGLNSLMLARLIIQLESTLGVDPFAQGASLVDARSIDDLVRVYENALGGSTRGDQEHAESGTTTAAQGALHYYRSVDDYLGPGDSRFFANGYRRVSHHIGDVVASPVGSDEPGVKTKVTLEYPGDWSKKTEQVDLTPHLSSVDMIVLAAQLSELHLSHSYGLGGEMRRSMRLLRVTLKAGTSPQEDLLEVPASARLRETEPTPGTEGRFVSVYDCEIGVMQARCEIEHPIATTSTIEGRFASPDEVLGPAAARYYGEGFKFRRQSIEDVIVDMQSLSSEAAVRIESVEGDHETGEGIEGRYQPSVSMIDCFVVSLQMAQIMIYELDSVDRRDSNTLWMLNTELHAEETHRPYSSAPLRARTVIDGKHLLPLHGAIWRNLDISGELGGITLRCSFAHELPTEAAGEGE
jgi:acyl carrier protein